MFLFYLILILLTILFYHTFFFFLMIDLYFLISAVIAQIFNPIAELVIPIQFTVTHTNTSIFNI